MMSSPMGVDPELQLPLKGRHSHSVRESDSGSETNIKINSPRRPVAENTISVNL